MSTSPISNTQLINASIDADTLGQVVNGDVTLIAIPLRLGGTVPSIRAYEATIAKGDKGDPGSGFSGLHVTADSGGSGGANDYNVLGTDDVVEYSGTGNVSLYHEGAMTAGRMQLIINKGTHQINVVPPSGYGCTIAPNKGALVIWDGTSFLTDRTERRVVTPNSSPYVCTYNNDIVFYNGPANGVVALPPITQGSDQGYPIVVYASQLVQVTKSDQTTVVATVQSGRVAQFTVLQGQWVITAASYGIMGASGANHAIGLVPDPGTIAGNTKFLREDGAWAIPAGTGGGGGGGVTYTPQDVLFIPAALNAAGIAAIGALSIPSTNAPQLGIVDPTLSGFAWLAFSKAAASPQYAYGVFKLPPNWTGSDIDLTFFSGSVTGQVKWIVDAAFVVPGAAITTLNYQNAATINANVAATANGVNTTATTANAAVPGTNAATAGSMMHFRISRDPTDTAVGDAMLLGVTLTTRRSS